MVLGDVQHLHKVHSQRDVQGDILGWNTGTGARQSRILAVPRPDHVHGLCVNSQQPAAPRFHISGVGKALLLSAQVPHVPTHPKSCVGE